MMRPNFGSTRNPTSIPSACRHHSGPSPGPGARLWPATSSIGRVFYGTPACSISPAGRGSSRSRRSWPVPRQPRRTTSTLSHSRPRRSMRRRMSVAIGTCGSDLLARDGGWDVVLAADIFYERDTASGCHDMAAAARTTRRDCSGRRSGADLFRPLFVRVPRPIRCPGHAIARGHGYKAKRRLAAEVVNDRTRHASERELRANAVLGNSKQLDDEIQPKAMRARFSRTTPGIDALDVPVSTPMARRAPSSSKTRCRDKKARAPFIRLKAMCAAMCLEG